MNDTHVISADAPPPATEAATAPVPATTTSVDELAEIKAQMDSLRGQLADSERANEFWRGRATAREETPPPVTRPEPEEDIDVLDVLTTKGAKGLDELLDRHAKKRGLVSAEEVEARVNTKANQLTTENELLKNYPDLADKKSEFFRLTAEHYGELVQQGVPQATAMRLAAQAAELDGFKSGKLKTPAQKAAETATQREVDRQARIKAQSGDRSARNQEPVEADDELSDNDRAAVRQLADALDIPIADAEKRYIARAKAGVNVSLKLDRRR